MIKTCEFAPMEGITLWPLRRAYAECFPGTACSYTPFIAANSTHSFKTREKKEIDPKHNEGLVCIPQILTNNPEAFIWAAGEIAEKGYGEVNFNLGCPSATVVTHGKGAGFLKDPDRLDRFFDDIFRTIGDGIRISVKTRIGVEEEKEAEKLTEIFNRYPIVKLIVHPRLRSDFYKGKPRMESFGLFYERIRHPLVYNGDIFTKEDAERISSEYPLLEGIMVGRGLLMNPSLAREMRGGAAFSKKELKVWHDRLLELMLQDIPEFSGVIGKMKEIWYYLAPVFRDEGKCVRRIKKSRTREEYTLAVNDLFMSAPLLDPVERTWRP